MCQNSGLIYPHHTQTGPAVANFPRVNTQTQVSVLPQIHALLKKNVFNTELSDFKILVTAGPDR